MRPTPVLLLLAALGLSACQTPREACEAAATRDLRIVEQLIRETEGNLRRGYAIRTEQRVDVDRRICEVDLPDGTERRFFCDRTDVVDVERPVAIDLNAERAKLDGLLDQRGRLLAQQDARLAACRATYPE